MSGTQVRRRSRLIPLVVAALLAASGLAGCTATGNASAPQGGQFELVTPGGKTEFSYPIAERRSLGEIAGPSTTGARVSINDFPDTVVVLNFWYAGCAPCREESPFLVTAANDLKPKGVQFLGINVQDDIDTAADFDAARGVPYPSILDPRKQTMLSIAGFPVNAVPSTIVLDRRHRVAHLWIGKIAGPADLVAVVAGVAAE